MKRVSIEVSDQDPKGERFAALLSTGLMLMVALIVGLLIADLVAGRWSVFGGAIVVSAVGLSTLPMLRWLHSIRRRDRIVTWGLDRPWQDRIERVAASVGRIESAMLATPPGAVRDHLDELRRTGIDYVQHLGYMARSAPPVSGQHSLSPGSGLDEPATIERSIMEQEAARIELELAELAKSGEALARRALDAGEISHPLHELRDRTNLLRDSLGDEAEPHAPS